MSFLIRVGMGWMDDCSNLTTPNFIGLISLQVVDDWRNYWMKNCNKLETTEFTSLMVKNRKKNIYRSDFRR
jgi:hypothetical protein